MSDSLTTCKIKGDIGVTSESVYMSGLGSKDI